MFFLKNKHCLSVQILVFFFLLNLVTSGGHILSGDDVQYFLVTENLSLNNSIKINPNSPSVEELTNNEWLKKVQKKYSSFEEIKQNENSSLTPFTSAVPLLLPFLSIPLYHLSLALGQNPVNFLGLIPNSIILSLTSLMIFLTSNHFFQSKKISFVLSVVFLISTWVWVYNTGMMLRPLASLLLLTGLYFTITTKNLNFFRPIIVGSTIGLSILASPVSILYIPGLMFFTLWKFKNNKKQIIMFLIGLIFLVIIQLSLNEFRYGSFIDFGYGFTQDISSHVYSEGIFGYIFSLGWGVFFNAPVLILFPIAMVFVFRTDKMLGILIAYCFIITWLFNGTLTSPHWSGFGGWGPRYFTIILPLLVISIGFVIKQYWQYTIFKASFIIFFIWGFTVNLLGKLIWFRYGYAYGNNKLNLLSFDDGWEKMNYNIFYSPVSLHFQSISTKFVETLPSTGVFGRGLAPCAFDLYIYCEYGVFSFIVIISVLIVLSYFIIKSITQDVIKYEN